MEQPTTDLIVLNGVDENDARASLREVLDYLESEHDGSLYKAAAFTARSCRQRKINGGSYTTCYIGHLLVGLAIPPHIDQFESIRDSVSDDGCYRMLDIEEFIASCRPEDNSLPYLLRPNGPAEMAALDKVATWTEEWLVEQGYQEV